MKKAIPIDINKNPSGGVRNFNDGQWEEMIQTYGKKLRWKLVKEELEKEQDEEQIWADSELEEEFFQEKEFIHPEPDKDLTKRELIEKYGLSEDLMKVSKAQIIKEISRI